MLRRADGDAGRDVRGEAPDKLGREVRRIAVVDDNGPRSVPGAALPCRGARVLAVLDVDNRRSPVLNVDDLRSGAFGLDVSGEEDRAPDVLRLDELGPLTPRWEDDVLGPVDDDGVDSGVRGRDVRDDAGLDVRPDALCCDVRGEDGFCSRALCRDACGADCCEFDGDADADPETPVETARRSEAPNSWVRCRGERNSGALDVKDSTSAATTPEADDSCNGRGEACAGSGVFRRRGVRDRGVAKTDGVGSVATDWGLS